MENKFLISLLMAAIIVPIIAGAVLLCIYVTKVLIDNFGVWAGVGFVGFIFFCNIVASVYDFLSKEGFE